MFRITKADKFLAKRLITNLLPSYHLTKRYIKKTERFTKEQYELIQFQNTRKVLFNAYTHIPYYRELFYQIGFHPHDFKEISDIVRIPFLDKATIRENADNMVARKFFKKLHPKVHTGGTTGVPLLLFRSSSDYGRERAYTEYAYEMLGIDHTSKTVYMRGKVADEIGKYWQFSDFGRTLYLSSHKLTDHQLGKYIAEIRKYEPSLLYTLPSVAVVLAEYMEKNSIPAFDTLKWVFCPSENLYDFQKAMIERVMKCQTGTFYGHAEHAVLATKCEMSSLYHVLPQYGYCELIDGQGRQVQEEGVPGEIVGTAFTNAVFPLIRYRTGDFGILSQEKCPCGREYMMLSHIQGREQCVAIAKNQTKISVGPELLCTVHDKTYGRVKRFRIEQHKPGRLTVFVKMHNSHELSTGEELFRRLFENKYPGLFDVTIKQWVDNQADKHLYFRQCIS